jgi:alanine racemase
MAGTAPSRAIIDLSAYKHNLGVVRELIPRQSAVMAVVKANAYGHGAVRIAKAAIEAGVSMLGVASIPEGVELRQAGITAPILVLVHPAESALHAAIEFGLRVMISDVRMAERLGELARRANRVVPVHCKVDTGMGRQGFDPEGLLNDLLHLTRISHIDIEGIATHFPVADQAKEPFTVNQIRRFRHLLRQIQRQGIPFEIAHAANSAAIVNYANGAFDMVRPGIMTYGMWPSDSPRRGTPLAPVLRWETTVVLVKQAKAASTIGYDRAFTAPRDMRVALLPVGYADGYKRVFSNRAHVLIEGTRCPVCGMVSMDQMVVDVSELRGVGPGAVATLIGSDGNEQITVQELAQLANTISYEILSGIGSRVARVYIE